MRQIIVTFTVMKWSWNEVTMTYMSGTNFFQKHQTVCCDICAMHNRFYVEGIRIYVPILQRTNNAYEMKLHRSLVKYFFYNLQTWLPLSLPSYSICFSLSFLHLFRHCYCHNSFFPFLFSPLIWHSHATIPFFLSPLSSFSGTPISSSWKIGHIFWQPYHRNSFFSLSLLSHHFSLSSLLHFLRILAMILLKFVSLIIFPNKFEQYPYHK